MGAQTTYSLTLTKAFAGMLAGMEHGAVIDSRVSEETSTQLPFGTAVARGAGNDGSVQPAGATLAAKVDGVIVHSHAYAKATDGTSATGDLGSTGLLPKAKLSVLSKGRMYVAVEDVVVRGDTLRVRHTTGTSEQVGGFRKAAVANKTLDLGRCAVVIEGNGSAGGLAVVEFDFGNTLGSADT